MQFLLSIPTSSKRPPLALGLQYLLDKFFASEYYGCCASLLSHPLWSSFVSIKGLLASSLQLVAIEIHCQLGFLYTLLGLFHLCILQRSCLWDSRSREGDGGMSATVACISRSRTQIRSIS